MLDRLSAGGAGGLSLEVDSLDSSNHNFRSTSHAKGKDIVGSYTMSAGGVFVAEVSTMLPWTQLHVEWDRFSVSIMTARRSDSRLC